jgi:uncharacterized membrane protein YagU involved in acid resistance
MQPLALLLESVRAGAIVVPVRINARHRPILAGAAYGALYCVAVNSLALPIFFGDPTPWQPGAATLLPSLIGHVVFGASIGLTSKRFVCAARQTAG